MANLTERFLSRDEDQVEEIRILQKFLPAPIRFKKEPHYIKKLVLMTEIRRHHLLSAGLRMTNLGDSDEIVFNQVRFKYSYRLQAMRDRPFSVETRDDERELEHHDATCLIQFFKTLSKSSHCSRV